MIILIPSLFFSHMYIFKFAIYNLKFSSINARPTVSGANYLGISVVVVVVVRFNLVVSSAAGLARKLKYASLYSLYASAGSRSVNVRRPLAEVEAQAQAQAEAEREQRPTLVELCQKRDLGELTSLSLLPLPLPSQLQFVLGQL